MVGTCCVPGCKTGYKSQKNSEKYSLFGFPADENLKQKWIAAIPRKNWVVSKNHKVCSRHFSSDDIQTTSIDSHDKRRCDRSSPTLQIQRLKQKAVPKIFPDLPKYLAVASSKPRSGLSSSAARQLQSDKATNERIEQFLN